MTKVRAKPSIAKPVIDARAAMEFVSAQHKSSAAVLPADESDLIATAKNQAPAGYVQLDVPLKEELYGRLEAEARRKGKTIAEMVGKLINKHIAKH
jgi:2-succinyl-5-enolpyruvyl-6-hydroxy-3-cyclohexene-1-carboxylate synthase